MSLPPNLGPRNGILSLTIKDKSVLYAAYMPFIRNGGLFIPTNKMRESEINQEGKARKLWDIEEGKGI